VVFLFLLIHFFISKVIFLVGLVFCRMMAMLDVGIHQSSGEPFSFFSFYCGGLIFCGRLVGWLMMARVAGCGQVAQDDHCFSFLSLLDKCFS